jgi:hypothetical protein
VLILATGAVFVRRPACWNKTLTRPPTGTSGIAHKELQLATGPVGRSASNRLALNNTLLVDSTDLERRTLAVFIAVKRGYLIAVNGGAVTGTDSRHCQNSGQANAHHGA